MYPIVFKEKIIAEIKKWRSRNDIVLEYDIPKSVLSLWGRAEWVKIGSWRKKWFKK